MATNTDAFDAIMLVLVAFLMIGSFLPLVPDPF
jgi:hypothetical protein